MDIEIQDSLWKAIALLTGSGLLSFLIFVIKKYADKLDKNLEEFRMSIQSLNIDTAVAKERLDNAEERLDKHDVALNGNPRIKYKS